jgi:hypothetical protein
MLDLQKLKAIIFIGLTNSLRPSKNSKGFIKIIIDNE